MTATIHLWICKIQTKRRFNRVAAVISPHFFIMNYYITIDQEFAVANGLTLTEVNCLAACFTLQLWSKKFNVEGETWFWYSEDKMVEEFPLLFGLPKRVYKNLKILANKGFIELSNIGRKKVLRITDKCSEWGRPKTKHQTENGLNETENGLNETENGLNETENGLNDYNIIDNNINDNNTIDKDGAKTDFSPEPLRSTKRKFSRENGLTPADLNVRQSTIDKIDAAFEQLVFPIDDAEIKKLFFVLCCSPKWRGKTVHALQMSLNKLQNYDRDFTIKLIEDSIAGGWQGLVFEDTDKKYQNYLRSRGSVSLGGKTTFKPMSEEERKEAMEYLNM